MKISAIALVALAGCSVLSAFDSLNRDQLALFQDAGGWEYISMNDADAGIRTEHTCFDGHPHPDTCRGTLTFSPGQTFAQNVLIHHQAVARSGKYKLDGDQLSLFDEFGTRDGPYTITIDTQKKSMVMQMPQIRVELLLEKEYRARQKSH